MVNLEIEYKVMISKEDFLKLGKNLPFQYTLYDQTNYYFETLNKDLLSKGLSLRIRRFNDTGTYLTTLKERKARNQHMEYEGKTDEKVFASEVLEVLKEKNVPVSELKETGSLRTIRKEYEIEGCLLCLDESHYQGKIDYEIECEASSIEKSKNTILNLLNKYDIPYEESKTSKQERALTGK